MNENEMRNLKIVAFRPSGYKIHPGDVYFDMKTKLFFQIREENIPNESYICSHFCTYYSDATTTISLQPLSQKYILETVLIKNIDEHPDLCFYNGNGWRSKWKGFLDFEEDVKKYELKDESNQGDKV